MQLLLLESFRRIRKASSRKHKGLRAVCDSAIEQLQKAKYLGFGPERYWEVLHLSFHSESNDVIEIVLESCTFFIRDGFVKPDATVEMNGKVTDFSQTLINTVCECKLGTDQARLWSAKCIQSFFLNEELKYNSNTLVRAMRVLHDSALEGKSSSTKIAAKEALQDVVRNIFFVMELAEKNKISNGASISDSTSTHTSSSVPASPHFNLDVNGYHLQYAHPIQIETMYPEVFSSLGFYLNNSNARSRESSVSENGINISDKVDFQSKQHRDAYICFRELCTFSENQSFTLLKLSLIGSVLALAGPALRTECHCIHLIQAHLCDELLKNCTSNIMPVVSLSLEIFVALIRNFKNHIKSEVEVFVTRIFLRILESENRSHEQKMLVLEVLCDICSDPNVLVEIFLNYDCDLYAIDLFKRIVTSLSKMAKIAPRHGTSLISGSISNERIIKENEVLRKLGLTGLSAVASSLHKIAQLDEYDSIESIQSSPVRETYRKRDAVWGLQNDSRPEFGHSGNAKGSNSPEKHHFEPNGVDFNDILPPVIDSQNMPLKGADPKFRNSDDTKLQSNIIKLNIQNEQCSGFSTQLSNPRIEEPNAENLHETELDKKLGSFNLPLEPLDGHTKMALTPVGLKYGLSPWRSATPGNPHGTFFEGVLPPSPKSVFDMKKKIQNEMENGIAMFNLNPEKGLRYLNSCCLVEVEDPFSVAKLFHEQAHRLNKARIGEFLGRSRDEDAGFGISVLHAYVDMIDFKNLAFDDAIRKFLGGFRLPGEAQKIDRIMEKFAERFCLDNPSMFPYPDAAFILAFSAIMLNTDLHNPAIREDKRMTKSGFVSNSKGICEGGSDLPVELLEGIYDRIAAAPISLKEDEYRVKGGSNNLSDMFGGTSARRKARNEALEVEREDMLKGGTEALRLYKTDQKRTSSRYIFADDVRSLHMHAKSLFEVAWGPAYGAFSQVLESSHDRQTVILCIKGLRQGLRLAGFLEISIARLAFINSLSRYCFVDSVQDLTAKNVDCINTVLNIALTDGNMLFDSWLSVLQCTSTLSHLQLNVSGLISDEKFFSADEKNSVLSENASMEWDWMVNLKRSFDVKSSPRPSEYQRSISEESKNLFSEIDYQKIDRIYTSSSNLNRGSLCSFVESLVEVSKNELSNTEKPRVYSLQRLVEVADSNMDVRSRIEWANVWGYISGHLANIGANNENSNLAMYAIDCLRQLALKFLTKEELRDFNFQRQFLGPFEEIMQTSELDSVRELVVSCIDFISATRGKMLQSGWKTILNVLLLGINDTHKAVINLSAKVIDTLVRCQFSNLKYDFLDVIKCLKSMSKTSNIDIALMSISNLQLCATLLANNQIETSKQRQQNHLTVLPKELLVKLSKSSELDTNVGLKKERLNLWWPVFVGLIECVSDSRLDLRSASILAFRDILRDFGYLEEFEIAWSAIFNCVIFPIMQYTTNDQTSVSSLTSVLPTDEIDTLLYKDSWIATTVPQIFKSIIDIFLMNLKSASMCISNLFEFFGYYACQNVEILARLAVQSLDQLIEGLSGPNRGLEILNWNIQFCERLTFLMRQNLPTFSKLTQEGELKALITRLVVALKLQHTVSRMIILHGCMFSFKEYKILLEVLRESVCHAHMFNKDKHLRQHFFDTGFMHQSTSVTSRQLPHLLPQEMHGLKSYLMILFDLYDNKIPCTWKAFEFSESLIQLEISNLFLEYLKRDTDIQNSYVTLDDKKRLDHRGVDIVGTYETEILYMEPIVIHVLNRISSLNNGCRTVMLQWVYLYICDLVMVQSVQIRTTVRGLLRSANVFHIKPKTDKSCN